MFAPELATTGNHFPREAIGRLAALEDRYFWFAARNELIRWLISLHFPRATSLLEVGCGTGVVLGHVESALPELELTGADLLLEMLEIARERVPDATLVQADIREIPYVEEFDIVCALDVIEHIDEDKRALDELTRALRPHGGLVISVPQHAWLWSAWDEFDRHRRRYSRRALIKLLRDTGLEVVHVTSMVTMLLPLVVVSRLRARRLTEDYDPFRELRIPSFLNRAFGAVMRAELSLIKHGASLPVGTSLVIVSRKQG